MSINDLRSKNMTEQHYSEIFNRCSAFFYQKKGELQQRFSHTVISVLDSRSRDNPNIPEILVP